MAFLEELLNSLKKPQGSPAMATPPFLPPGQAPAPHPPLASAQNPAPQRFDFAESQFPTVPLNEVTVPQREKIGMDQILPEVTVPDRQLSAGVLQEVSAPNRERVSGMIDQPWYKDKDTMEDLGARLSQAFGSLTMRGNSAAETAANMKRMQASAANKQKNKTMDYLIKNNPEMAKTLLNLPEQYRGKAMETMLGMVSGEESAFAEKVRMYKAANPNAKDSEALDWARGGNGTNVTVNNGGGNFADALGTQAAEWYKKKSGAYSNINDMKRVVSTIETAIANGDQLSGGIINYLPDDVQDLFAPQSQDVRRSVEKVIQSSLKETLGAQFTEKEGENVIKRTWNPKAPIEYNLRRTKQLLAELQSYAAGQDRLLEGMLASDGNIMEWMRNNPGSGGATAESIRYLQYDDPLDAGLNPEPASSGSSGPPADIDPEVWAEMTEEQRALFNGL